MTPAEVRIAQAKAMREVPEFTTLVIQLAQALGWRVHHQRPGQEQSGKWSSAIQGDKGWPDIALVRRGYFAVRELKRFDVPSKMRPTKDQEEWLYELGAAGVDAAVWTTLDWFDGTIERWLRETGA